MTYRSLATNGSLDPDLWRPEDHNDRTGTLPGRIPAEGDLIGWRYGGWRVIEVRLIPEHDIRDDVRATLNRHFARLKEEVRLRAWMRERPRIIVIQHENGPMIIKPGEHPQRLHDDSYTVHLGTTPLRPFGLPVVREPYRACSCHGHIWPCQDVDRAALAANQADKMEKLLATAEPGRCAHCLEAITPRQSTLTFPEPSRFVPGAPGPTFHAGRARCWAAAEQYERTGRLVDDPDVARLACCPGVRFIHEAHAMAGTARLDCTAGTLCTGLHGPAGYRYDVSCWAVPGELSIRDGVYAHPTFDCGYRQPDRACLGANPAAGTATLNPIAADIYWRRRNPQEEQ